MSDLSACENWTSFFILLFSLLLFIISVQPHSTKISHLTRAVVCHATWHVPWILDMGFLPASLRQHSISYCEERDRSPVALKRELLLSNRKLTTSPYWRHDTELHISKYGLQQIDWAISLKNVSQQLSASVPCQGKGKGEMIRLILAGLTLLTTEYKTGNTQHLCVSPNGQPNLSWRINRACWQENVYNTSSNRTAFQSSYFLPFDQGNISSSRIDRGWISLQIWIQIQEQTLWWPQVTTLKASIIPSEYNISYSLLELSETTIDLISRFSLENHHRKLGIFFAKHLHAMRSTFEIWELSGLTPLFKSALTMPKMARPLGSALRNPLRYSKHLEGSSAYCFTHSIHLSIPSHANGKVCSSKHRFSKSIPLHQTSSNFRREKTRVQATVFLSQLIYEVHAS